jgi:hypothetical protein
MNEIPNTRMMTAHGYTLEHTGGGCRAWHRPVEDGYLMITDYQLGLTAAASSQEWSVGRYLDDGEQYGWIVTGEVYTLEGALAVADKLPLPQQGYEQFFYPETRR